MLAALVGCSLWASGRLRARLLLAAVAQLKKKRAERALQATWSRAASRVAKFMRTAVVKKHAKREVAARRDVVAARRAVVARVEHTRKSYMVLRINKAFKTHVKRRAVAAAKITSALKKALQRMRRTAEEGVSEGGRR